jgi:glucose/arabinose dehydrogenase
MLAGFKYAIYVDGARSELVDVSCAATPAAEGFACSGKGPDLPPGSHTLELAAFTPDGESPRSSPLTVSVSGAASTESAQWPGGIADTTPDGVSLHVEKVTDGLDNPVDAAFAPDGRLFVAERSGRIRIVDRGQLQIPDALAQPDARADALLSIAVDPEFERTHFVFALLAGRTGSEDVFQLARYRELRGVLAQRAVLLEAAGPPAADAAAVLRAGGDGKLFLAIGGPGFPGMLLRVNLDGTMPHDQAGTTPTLAQGLQIPRGLAMDPRSGILWIADEQDGQAHLSGVALLDNPLRAVVRGRHAVTAAGSLAFYAGATMPGFEHTLLIGSASGRHIERIRLSDAQPYSIATSQSLLQDTVGPIDVVVVAPDGTIYFCAGQTLGRITAA